MIWEEQWKLFAPNFKDGKAHINLTAYGSPQTLQLYPGPGFGDLSHPTTRLVLRLMKPYLKGRYVIDIGCGSGILSIAAAAMGAQKVYGYDIDPEAVQHAQHNLEISPYRDRIFFSTHPPPHVPHHSLLLMNMISLDQGFAWEAIAENIIFPTPLITSGILTKDEKDYIAWKKEHRCELLQILREDEWSGFVFN